MGARSLLGGDPAGEYVSYLIEKILAHTEVVTISLLAFCQGRLSFIGCAQFLDLQETGSSTFSFLHFEGSVGSCYFVYP